MKTWFASSLILVLGSSAFATTVDLATVTNDLYKSVASRGSEEIEIPGNGDSVAQYRKRVMNILANSEQSKIAVLPPSEAGRDPEYFILGKTPRNENCLVKLSRLSGGNEATGALTLVTPSTAGLIITQSGNLTAEQSAGEITGNVPALSDVLDLDDARTAFRISLAADGSLQNVSFTTTFSRIVYPRTFLGKLLDGLAQTGPNYRHKRETVTRTDDCRL